MWYFEARYFDISDGKTYTRVIHFDGDSLFKSEMECYLHAITKAYEMKKEDEILEMVSFVGC